MKKLMKLLFISMMLTGFLIPIRTINAGGQGHDPEGELQQIEEATQNLRNLVNQINGQNLIAQDFTPESWGPFERVLASANKMLEIGETGAFYLFNVRNYLNDLFNGLVLREPVSPPVIEAPMPTPAPPVVEAPAPPTPPIVEAPTPPPTITILEPYIVTPPLMEAINNEVEMSNLYVSLAEETEEETDEELIEEEKLEELKEEDVEEYNDEVEEEAIDNEETSGMGIGFVVIPLILGGAIYFVIRLRKQ